MTFALVPAHMKGREVFKRPQLESVRVTSLCIKVEMKPHVSNPGFQRARRLMRTASHPSSKQWKCIIHSDVPALTQTHWTMSPKIQFGIEHYLYSQPDSVLF